MAVQLGSDETFSCLNSQLQPSYLFKSSTFFVWLISRSWKCIAKRQHYHYGWKPHSILMPWKCIEVNIYFWSHQRTLEVMHSNLSGCAILNIPFMKFPTLIRKCRCRSASSKVIPNDNLMVRKQVSILWQNILSRNG